MIDAEHILPGDPLSLPAITSTRTQNGPLTESGPKVHCLLTSYALRRLLARHIRPSNPNPTNAIVPGSGMSL